MKNSYLRTDASLYRKLSLYVMATMILLPCFCYAKTLHVDPAGNGIDGLSWPSAFRKISDAILHSENGDTLWIKMGTYNESVVLDTRLTVYGGFAGNETSNEIEKRDPARYRTVIDAADLSNHAIAIISDATLHGLTITGGDHPYGGGLYCQSSVVLIRDCTITLNSSRSDQIEPSSYAAAGAGIYCVSTQLTLLNTAVTANYLEGIEARQSRIAGSGIYGLMSRINLSMCKISDNVSQHAEYHFGSGISVEKSCLSVDNSEISNNDNAYNVVYDDHFGFQQVGGGAALAAFLSPITISDCTIINNIERSPIESSILRITECTLSILRCTLAHNRCTQEFSRKCDLRISASTGQITNAVFYNGQIPTMYLPDSVINISYSSFARNVNATRYNKWLFELVRSELQAECIVGWGNELEYALYDIGSSTAAIRNSNLEVRVLGEGNISVDPMFVEPSTGDFRLRPGSPCIDTASTSGPALDIAKRPRPVDVIGTGRDGPGAFDMGAYEFQLAPADFNKDGAVNAKDLLIFQTYWNETQYN